MARAMIHHTLEPGMDQSIFVGMSEPIRKTYTILENKDTIAQEIDRVIEEGVRSRLPVYIYVPTDVAGVQVPISRLETPLDTTVRNTSSQKEDEVVRLTTELIKNSSNPAILVDVLAVRHGGKELSQRFVNVTGFPTYSTPLSKGVVDETSPYYNGLYNGQGILKKPVKTPILC
jgi:pyruvate decarboxylase